MNPIKAMVDVIAERLLKAGDNIQKSVDRQKEYIENIPDPAVRSVSWDPITPEVRYWYYDLITNETGITVGISLRKQIFYGLLGIFNGIWCVFLLWDGSVSALFPNISSFYQEIGWLLKLFLWGNIPNYALASIPFALSIMSILWIVASLYLIRKEFNSSTQTLNVAATGQSFPFGAFRGIQIIKRWGQKNDFYEVNLVLENQERVNIFVLQNPYKAREYAEKISNLLNISVWELPK